MPLYQVPAIVEFFGFYTPRYMQCSMIYEMTLDDFLYGASNEVWDSEEGSLVWDFSQIDLENNCTINQ